MAHLSKLIEIYQKVVCTWLILVFIFSIGYVVILGCVCVWELVELGAGFWKDSFFNLLLQ